MGRLTKARVQELREQFHAGLSQRDCEICELVDEIEQLMTEAERLREQARVGELIERLPVDFVVERRHGSRGEHWMIRQVGVECWHGESLLIALEAFVETQDKEEKDEHSDN